MIGTLRPALAKIDDDQLRERPADTARITYGAHAARAALWPVIDRLTAEDPDINVEISIKSGLTDIVSGKYDAGVQLGELLDHDMIAIPISPRQRMAAFAAPSYLEQHDTPYTPYDLAKQNCISLRMATSKNCMHGSSSAMARN
ncbi:MULTISPECIES: LysR substrate-binding domain-containing protein [unclassified Sphingomonas]|uniref:LysR substrate-binding domain-containing protein n=1 Tax=unclassified Sphingomonas TaxID=196159 RepID=UPI00226A9C7E|nr:MULTISPECIES: LysR substrate-binding domain-containing protein [unclassified Sphingomonas]